MIETVNMCKPYTSIHHFYNMNFTCNLVAFWWCHGARLHGKWSCKSGTAAWCHIPRTPQRRSFFFGGGHGKTSALRMILRIRGTNKRQWQPLKPCMFESYREEQKKDKKVSRVDSLVHPYACMYHHVFSVVFQAHDAFYLLWPQSEGWQSGKNYTSMDPK